MPTRAIVVLLPILSSGARVAFTFCALVTDNHRLVSLVHLLINEVKLIPTLQAQSIMGTSVQLLCCLHHLVS